MLTLVRSKIEGTYCLYGIHFHGIEKRINIQAINLLLRNVSSYPFISLLRKPTSLCWEDLYALNVCRVIEDNDIDLIHAHFAHPEGLVGLLVKRRARKPLVVTVHGHDILVDSSIRYGVRLSKRFDSLIHKVLNSAALL